uniref:Protein MAK10 homolog n=1 Tax=Angiostrongylus cantonensis TaxID=6313 RepID=A0A0K0D9D5_ANGCA
MVVQMTEEDHQESDGERELSDSDSESELDIVEYEKRREQCFRLIVLSEIQFNKLKLILRDLKIKQLTKRRQEILNQVDPEFTVKHRELQEEFNARVKLAEAIRCLEMDSLERRTVGLTGIAQTNQDDNKVIVQEKIRERILNKIQAEKEHQLEIKIVKSYFLDGRFDLKRERSEENFDFPPKKTRSGPLRMANSELRELLDKASRKLDLPFNNEEPIDITNRFFEDCSRLSLGEVVRYDSFSLGEAMSAVELMDEKMDIGMKKGLYESSLAEQLTTYDATLCAFVTWLEGSCIGQTLWTNVLLTDPERVRFDEHPVFACLSHGFYQIVMIVKSIIQNASVYEEVHFP